ncbi:MAG: serine hydrolase [Gemmatimonadota bacterium]
MRIRFRPLATAGTLLLLLFVPATVRAQTDPLSGLDGFIREVLETWSAPGMAVAVVHDDRVLLARGWGVREVGRADPVDEHTLFAIASTSKAFTTAAMGMLVDEERVSWDDPVTDHLPGFQLFDPYVTRELTIRDLLSHRSGLPRGDRLWYASPFTRAEIMERVRYLEPGWSFRSRYGYQNIMFLTAGELVGKVAGTTWDAFVDERIFTPLGMERSNTTTRDIEARGNVATPHVFTDTAVVTVGWRDFDNLGGAGAINSSAADMAQWLRLQLGNGTYEGTELFSDSVTWEMRGAVTVIPRGQEARETFPETHLQAYGLGWTLQDYRGRLVVRHGGSLDGMRTHVALMPEEDVGVVVLTNLNVSVVPQLVAFHVLDRFLAPREDGSVKDWNDLMRGRWLEDQAEARERREATEAERVTGTTPSLALDAYVGTYQDVLYGTANVSLEEGALVLDVGPYFIGTLEHWHFDTFRARWRERGLGTAMVTFQLGADGQVAEVRVGGFDRFIRAPEGP